MTKNFENIPGISKKAVKFLNDEGALPHEMQGKRVTVVNAGFCEIFYENGSSGIIVGFDGQDFIVQFDQGEFLENPHTGNCWYVSAEAEDVAIEKPTLH